MKMRESTKVVKIEANSPPPPSGVDNNLEDANPVTRRMKFNPQQNGTIANEDSGQSAMPSTASAAATTKMLSSLTVEKYILQVHQKDEKIRKLEEENGLLRSTLIAKTNEYKVRVDELVSELERHAELVTKLQSELLNSRKNFLSKSSLPFIKRESPPKKLRRMPPPSTPNSTPTIAPKKGANSQTSQSQNLAQSDEIFAKLQTFVEKNSSPISTNNFAAAEQTNQNMDEEFGPEQIFKAMAEDPNLLQAFLQAATTTTPAVENEPEEEEGDKIDPAANILAALFAADPNSNDLGLIESGGSSKSRKDGANNRGGMEHEEQQNLDFEEVMQRVIGDAMNGGNGVNGVIKVEVNEQIMANGGRGTKAKAAGGFSTPSTTASVSGGKAGKRKGGGNGAGGTANPIVGTPLALPKGVTMKGNMKKDMEGKMENATGLLPTSMASHLPASNSHSNSSSSSSTAKPFTPEEQKLVNELESRIDENIVQLGLRPLNTAELAVQCTRMMREYSIGQRLFARTVMYKVSQSQGSLSELLSKPRPWHKLTDKGRDSFRRIFGWISDDTAIELLCELSPRKVTITEKIPHPDPATLLEPLDGPDSAAMLESSLGTGKKGLRQTHSSGGLLDHPHSPRSAKMDKIEPTIDQSKIKFDLAQNAAIGLGSMFGGVGGRWRHDDIPKEKIIAIHEAEKAKLMEKTTTTGIGSNASGSSRMSSVSPSPVGTATAGSNLNKVRAKPGFGGLDEFLIGRSPSAHSATSSIDQSGNLSDTNNFVSHFFAQQRGMNGGGNRQEPFPISQSQIELYSHLDTENVVQQVKEFLAKNAISQRQFGESILGLSQGSVSDLLARPKAWSSLTAKGREPFVRMQIFLEQYSRAAEMQEDEGEESGALKIDEEEEEEIGDELAAADSTNETAEERSEIDDNLAASSEDSDKLLQSILEQIKTEQSGEEIVQNLGKKATAKFAKNEGQKGGNRPSAAAANQQQIVVDEATAAMNLQEINTVDVAKRVKECLSKNGISQRAFGEHILKMTSGCVSDLLTKHKAWALLSWKQRQSYQKMSEFLADPGAVDRLRSDEQHRCEMNNALNALKAIAGATTNSSMNSMPNSAAAVADNNNKSALAGLTALVEQHSSSASSSQNSSSTHSSSASALQIVTNLASELGANTPIGTILKKANSPKPTANGQQNGIGHSGATKRKASSTNGTPLSMVKIEAGNEVALLAGPPAKKIPRFQRTLITDKQKEALLFVFAHEQRPNARCIEQLAAKIGLAPRTVTNWFHNYRTRQKVKEIKQDEDAEELPTQAFSNNNNNNSSQTSTPAQVLARALNASDSKTAKWFREIAELLRRHSDANVDLDSIGTRGSLGTTSAESSPSSPQEEANGEREHSCGASSPASASSPLQSHHQGGGGGSQLDKAIARMHSRLAATGKVQ